MVVVGGSWVMVVHSQVRGRPPATVHRGEGWQEKAGVRCHSAAMTAGARVGRSASRVSYARPAPRPAGARSALALHLAVPAVRHGLAEAGQCPLALAGIPRPGDELSVELGRLHACALRLGRARGQEAAERVALLAVVGGGDQHSRRWQ